MARNERRNVFALAKAFAQVVLKPATAEQDALVQDFAESMSTCDQATFDFELRRLERALLAKDSDGEDCVVWLCYGVDCCRYDTICTCRRTSCWGEASP